MKENASITIPYILYMPSSYQSALSTSWLVILSLCKDYYVGVAPQTSHLHGGNFISMDQLSVGILEGLEKLRRGLEHLFAGKAHGWPGAWEVFRQQPLSCTWINGAGILSLLFLSV